MAKFDRAAAAAVTRTLTGRGPRAVRRGRTHEGGAAYLRDVRGELFLLAVSNLVGESTFYEGATERDERYRALLHEAVALDPDWVARLVGWLRGTAQLRSAAVVAAAEYVRAGGPHGRRVVDAALQRADEPAELLAYWTLQHGRRLPQPVKRGVADAVRRLYGERSALKYDGAARTWRMADVVDLTHPAPRDQAQSDLFRWLLDRRHGRQPLDVPATLPLLRRHAALAALAPADRRALVEAAAADPQVARTFTAAGMTWEALAGWLGGPMDAAAWQAVIPSMGYMALLRNLRNFDRAGVPDRVAEQVAQRLADPAEVAASRQLPYRFVAAHRTAPSLRWGHALDRALEAATANVPAFRGRTLVLVDTSASMRGGLSKRSTMSAIDAAAVFGVTLAKRGDAVDLVGFADGVFDHRVERYASLLTEVDRFTRRVGEVGHGTRIASAVRASYRGHGRVVLVSDMQTFAESGPRRGPRATAGYEPVATDLLPERVPVYGFVLGGHRPTVVRAGAANRFELGGLNDATFRLIDLLESRGSGGAQGDGGWPF